MRHVPNHPSPAAREPDPNVPDPHQAGLHEADLWALAEYVLESRAGAEEFLRRPHALLDGRAPLELAATPDGARRVAALLWRLEYSLPV